MAKTKTTPEPVYDLAPVLLNHGRWVRVGDYAVRLEANGYFWEIYCPRKNAIGTRRRGGANKGLVRWLAKGAPTPKSGRPLGLRFLEAPAGVGPAWKRIIEKALTYEKAVELAEEKAHA